MGLGRLYADSAFPHTMPPKNSAAASLNILGTVPAFTVPFDTWLHTEREREGERERETVQRQAHAHTDYRTCTQHDWCLTLLCVCTEAPGLRQVQDAADPLALQKGEVHLTAGTNEAVVT